MRALRTLRFGPLLFTHRLTGVGLLLTRRCNLSCAYCQVVRAAPVGTLPPAEWARIIDRFVCHRHRHFVLTGGEPLLYYGLGEVIAHARRKALVSIITNGTLITPENLGLFAGADFVTVSMDSLDAGSKDGKGALRDKAELLLEGARRHGYTVKTITTITSQNLQTAPDVIEWVLSRGMSAMLSVIHAGRVEEGTETSFRRPQLDLVPQSPAELEALQGLVQRLLALRDRYPRFLETREYIRGIPDFLQGRFQMDCAAGDEYFEIDSDGTILACHDAIRSGENALTFTDYDEMKAAVRRTVPPDCTCYYNCFYNNMQRRRRPLRSALDLASQAVRGW